MGWPAVYRPGRHHDDGILWESRKLEARKMTAVNTETSAKSTGRASAPNALLGELSEALRRVRHGELDVRLTRRAGGR